MSLGKKIAIGVAALILIASAIAIYMVFDKATKMSDAVLDDEQDTEIVETTNETENSTAANNISIPSGGETSEVTEDTSANENVTDDPAHYAELAANIRWEGHDRYENGKPQPNVYDSRGAGQTAQQVEDKEKLAQYDSARIKTRGEEFIRAFTTYNSQTLANGSYRRSIEGYVTISSVTTNLLRQHMNQTWNENCGTYKEMVSCCDNIISISDPYISHVSNDNIVALSVKVRETRNSAAPGELDWEIVGTYDTDYAIYFDSAYNIIDLRKQYSKAL